MDDAISRVRREDICYMSTNSEALLPNHVSCMPPFARDIESVHYSVSDCTIRFCPPNVAKKTIHEIGNLVPDERAISNINGKVSE